MKNIMKKITKTLIYTFLICLTTSLNAMNKTETKDPRAPTTSTPRSSEISRPSSSPSTSSVDDLLLACQTKDLSKIMQLFTQTLTAYETESSEDLLLNLSKLTISTKDLQKVIAQISMESEICRPSTLYFKEVLQALINEFETREIGVEPTVWVDLEGQDRLMKLDDYINEEENKEEAGD